MKYYNKVNLSGLTYEDAISKGKFITNNDYGGFIFINKNDKLASILVTGEIALLELSTIKDKDKKIWKTVTITGEAYSILTKSKMLL